MSARRELSLFDAVCLGINAIVGSGIFLFPGELARLLGRASPLAFVLAAGSAAVIGFCLAELSGRFDRTGGTMVYAAEAFGPFAGFSVGWLNFLSFVFGWAAVARGVGGYLGKFIPIAGTPVGEAVVAVAIVAIFAVVNYRGIKLAAWVTDFFTVGKLVPLIIFALAGLALTDWSRFAQAAPAAATSAPWTQSWGRAWFVCMFAIGGYENVAITAGETKDPRRAIPIAIVGSLAGAALLYVLVQTAAFGAFAGLGDSKAPLADAGAAVMGPFGGFLLAAGAAISMTGFTSGSAIFTPRALLALAENGDLPKALADTHPRFGSPHRAIVVAAVIAAIASALMGFGKLAEFDLVAMLLAYSLSCAALPKLRKRADLPAGSFRVPAPYLFSGAAVALALVLATRANLAALVTTAVLFVLGMALRFVSRRVSART